ncbi:hypothetical protein TCDM_04395 [Trypanosoma cruzi Dm28c]|uniref:Ras-GAP domain-containing protein n=1 Tax=Trypanosoma cruzi Dm28c TaxID=1416333 RepID=V5BGK0_TRYCR|nr:hypothetical protein TCDM_04395 [Trypanosoma cruzi Dm28c]
MNVPFFSVISSDEKKIFQSSGSGMVLKKTSEHSSKSHSRDKCSGLTVMLRALAQDNVLLLSILHGVPEEEQDKLAELLVHVLWIASEISPIETSQILSVLLLLELDCARHKRNDVHTFMRGNGVVPKVFEALLARVTSNAGGLEEQLLNCCHILREDDVAPTMAGSESRLEEDGGESRGEASSPKFPFEGLNYLEIMTTVPSEDDGGISHNEDAYTQAIVEMAYRISNVVYASVCQWPWSLRQSLRCLLETVGASFRDDVHLGPTGSDVEMLTVLQQNVMATIVVLRAVVPALLNTVPRLLPGVSCFDTHYILMQKRCTLLAKLSQKAAHGLLFSGPHEREMTAFNREIPALTKRWADVFLCVCHKTDPPTPREESDLMNRSSEVALQFFEFLDHHVVHLLHWVLQHKPLLEPTYCGRLLCLIRYAERRLGTVGHFTSISSLSELTFPVTNDGSNSSRMPRPAFGLFSRLGHFRQLSDGHAGSNNVENPPPELIFDELLSYALSVLIDPEITKLHASFCGISGIASDGTVGIFVYLDLLSLYLAEYQAEEGIELQRRCPNFFRYRKPFVINDGDSFAYLFLFMHLAVSAKGSKGFRLFVVASNSSRCCSWVWDAFRLLPSIYTAQCAHVLLLNPGDVHFLPSDRERSFGVTVCRRASELFLVLEELRLHLPLGCVEYQTLLLKGKEEHDQIFGKLFPPVLEVEPNNTGENGFDTGVESMLHASPYVHIWPLALMWEVFVLIQSAIAPPEASSLLTIADGVGSDTGVRPIPSIPKHFLGQWRMNAVEFFYNFEGELLLHLEIEPKWLPKTILGSYGRIEALLRPVNHHERRFRCSWFAVTQARESEVEAYESCLMRVLFLASRRFFAWDGLCSNSGPSKNEYWPNVVPSLRHTTLESLWRLLLYNLWNTFALLRQLSQGRCPITCLTEVVRAYLGRSSQQTSIADHLHLLAGDEALLKMAANAIANSSAVGCGLLRLIVEICAFVRKIDVAEIGSAASKHDGADAARKNAMTDGVIRIIFRNEELDDAELLVAYMIATQGRKLLPSVCNFCPPIER